MCRIDGFDLIKHCLSLHDSHMVVVVYCFPFLEEFDIIFSLDSQAYDFGVTKLCSMGLLKIMVGRINILLK